MKTKLILLTLFLVFAACSNGGTVNEKKTVKPRYYIPNEEIQTIIGVNNVYDIVSRSRPVWLRGRGAEPSVYMNGIPMGGLDALSSISVNMVKDIKFLTPSEATTMYGTNNMGGVIEVRTK
ncbi:MAG: TonB-dependent receptor plug domain-containing protein [Candidatus Marinimicrobia bacterium]|jgi:outer membrane receptor protein involved in Fe transport|nr:TonB-dependent receptor plug domain-containing protein [Candidatus Neomarinimicrobiota bacterium]